MSIYSAAIIGAGPVGCVAAIALARKGLKVLLIDVSEFSGDRADSSSVSSTECGTGLGRRTWRSLRNQCLIAVAQAQGAEVWKACRVDAAILEQGQLMGLSTERGAVRAYHILDASGQRQWLSRQLGVGIAVSSPELMAQPKQVMWQVRDHFAGPGWWLLGDAAAISNPVMPHKLLRAFTSRLQAVISALRAALAIADCERGAVLEALAAQKYSQWLKTRFIRGAAPEHTAQDMVQSIERSSLFKLSCVELHYDTP